MMYKKVWILLFLFLWAIPFYGQEAITESNYLRLDSLLWKEYENEHNRLSWLWDSLPDKRDSIQQLENELYRRSSRKNVELALRYASVPSGLERLFRVRRQIAKDTLEKILNSLSKEMQKSFTGKNIRAHIQTKQIEEGDTIRTFPCIQDDGQRFDWASIRGKQLLLLYGGLGCMGKEGRQALKRLYETTSREDLIILVYWSCDSLQELQEIKQYYGADYTLITDFKNEASPIRIDYGTQATPTCFLTDKRHRVVVKCMGLDVDRFRPYIFQTTEER